MASAHWLCAAEFGAHSQAVGVEVGNALCGILTGKYNQGQGSGRQGLASPSERNLAIAAEVVKIAREHGCSPSQVALSWVRQQPGVIIPVLGARTVAQWEENLQCVQVTLTQEEMSRLDAVSQIDLGYPHTYLQPTDPHTISQSVVKEKVTPTSCATSIHSRKSFCAAPLFLLTALN